MDFNIKAIKVSKSTGNYRFEVGSSETGSEVIDHTFTFSPEQLTKFAQLLHKAEGHKANPFEVHSTED